MLELSTKLELPTRTEGPAPRFRWLLALSLFLLTAPSTSAQLTDASCTLTFDATWSAQTHPISFPSSAHFSGLIGGTHNTTVRFWEEGALASPGIEAVAETGSKTLLLNEVQNAVNAGTAGELISGGGVGVSPGSVSVNFDATLAHSKISVVTMIAPSPDWFLGVDGLDLFVNGSWIPQQVAALPPFDAGTDSGLSFIWPDTPTVPPQAIFEITTTPLPGPTSLGTFTVACTSPLLFTGGFESGDLTGWTVSEP